MFGQIEKNQIPVPQPRNFHQFTNMEPKEEQLEKKFHLPLPSWR